MRSRRELGAACLALALGCGESAPAPALSPEPDEVTSDRAPEPVAAPIPEPEVAPVIEPVAPPAIASAVAPPPARLALSDARGCVIGADGAVLCFPIAGRPPIGDAIAAPVDGLADAVTLAAAGEDVCAVDRSGMVRCVTFRYRVGTPGAPRTIDALRGVRRIVVTEDGVCGLDDAGAVRCAEGTSAPTTITLPGPAIDLASNGYETCAAVAGGMHCWSRSRPPRPVETQLNGVRALASTREAGCALSASGVEATCYGELAGSWYYEDFEWEDEERGPVNAMEAPLSPGGIATLPFTARSISAARDHGCALGETGRVSCWGAAFRTGRTEGFEPRPVVAMASGVTEIAGGGGPYVGVTCAIQGGVVRCFYSPDWLANARPGERPFRVCASGTTTGCDPLRVDSAVAAAPSATTDDAATTTAASPPTATVPGCVVHDESGTPLNVRAEGSGRAEVIGTLTNGARVTVLESRGPWRRVDGPPAGWVWNEAIDCE